MPASRMPRRRARPSKRWSDPVSPLQAARFEHCRNGQQVVDAIRELCPGHGEQPCRLDAAKLSEYENGARRPGLVHIEALCRYYQKSPEMLGLIAWRNGATPESEGAPPTNPAHCQRDHIRGPEDPMLVWLRDSAVTVATAVLRALAECPVRTDPEPAGQQRTSDGRPPDDEPPDGAAVPI